MLCLHAFCLIPIINSDYLPDLAPIKEWIKIMRDDTSMQRNISIYSKIFELLRDIYCALAWEICYNFITFNDLKPVFA